MRRYLSALALLPALAGAQLLPEERQGIADALFLDNLAPSDLNYARRLPAAAGFALPKQMIDTPLDGADALLSLHRAGIRQAPLPAILSQFGGSLTPMAAPAVTLPADLPAPLRAPLTRIIGAMLIADRRIDAATKALTAEERRALILGMPHWAADGSLKFGFGNAAPEAMSVLANLRRRMDVSAILRAGEELGQAIDSAMPQLQAVARSGINGVSRFKVGDLQVEIAGVGKDSHTEGADLCLDFGGADSYSGRYGGGLGRSSVLIDLAGNDAYDVPDLAVGAGLLGVGLAYDLGGHDGFRGKALAFGAGILGMGALVKDGGDDTYSARGLTQGFGMYGLGLLLDTRGDDRYSARILGQGAARTEGLGWLVDRQGEDTYRAEALGAMIQGASIGLDQPGADHGGVGLLTDGQGDDAYLGGTASQAVARGLGVGSLADFDGNDSYSAFHEAQASARATGAALLFDQEGSDTYSVRVGSCHALGHESGVAVLVDRAGDDLYSARDSRPGMGNAGGLGLFLDVSGEDRYYGPPGAATASTGGGSLGVFVDMGGADRYAEGLADVQGAVRGEWGISLDLAGPEGSPAAEPTRTQPGSVPLPAAADLANLYAAATAPDAGARAATDRLTGIGMPALKWMLTERLGSAGRNGLRVIGIVASALGEEGRAEVASKIASPIDEEARNALILAGQLRAASAATLVTAALKRAPIQVAAARAAGEIRAKDAVPELMVLAGTSDPTVALAAIAALDQIADPASLATAQALFRHEQLPVRRSALRLAARFPGPAIEAASGLLADPDERRQRMGIELLGLVGNEQALTMAGRYLQQGTPGTKIQAMLALNGRVPEGLRPALANLLNDPSPLVRAVAARIDPGR